MILDVLKLRNHRMELLKSYFCRQSVSAAAKENFNHVIKVGKNLLILLTYEQVVKIENEIENYLVACEEVILAIGIEIKSEFCDVIEILEDFRDERLLLMMVIGKGYKGESFT